MVFLANFLLMLRDYSQFKKYNTRVGDMLRSLDDQSDEHFLAAHPTENSDLLLKIRQAISDFFEVPSTKIHRDAHLIDDLNVHKLQPSFQFSVVNTVISSQPDKQNSFFFCMDDINTIDEFAQAIANIPAKIDNNA
ncbi:hypothetical protein [Rubinisphaera italica]|nr:hypothetical protein [Rubinisphaera italica]